MLIALLILRFTGRLEAGSHLYHTNQMKKDGRKPSFFIWSE